MIGSQRAMHLQPWEFVIQHERLIRFTLFQIFPKHLTCFAFGSASDAVQDCRLHVFESVKKRPELLDTHRPSTLVVNWIRWLMMRRINQRVSRRIETLSRKIRDVEDRITPAPFDAAEMRLLSEACQKALRSLTYREREIMKLRYGFGDGHSYTLRETARIFSVGPERIRQIESKAIRKLQEPKRRALLEKFTNN